MDCCSKSKARRWPWIILLIVVAIVVLLTVLSEAKGQPLDNDAASVITNKTCPVTVGEPVDPEQWVEYQGQRVYFCCRMCKRKFEREPEKYLANLPHIAIGAAAGQTDPGGHADEHGHDNDVGQADEPAAHDAGSKHTHAAAPEDHTSSVTEGGHGKSAADSEESAEHDHAAHEHGGEQTGLVKLISWLGNFHPPSVNFPIALLINGALAELLFMITGRSLFAAAARFCVWLGSVSTIGAVILGWFFAGFRWTDPDWIMTVHRWLGTAAGIWVIMVLTLCIAAYQSDGRGRRWLPWYRLTLFIGALAVAANGFFGGAMIYGLDHYAW